MRIPFVDSDLEDLIITDDEKTEVRSFSDDEFGGVKIEDDDEIYSQGFDAYEEEEPTFDNDHDYTSYDYDGDDYSNTITSTTRNIPRETAPVPLVRVNFKKYDHKVLLAIGCFIPFLSALWFAGRYKYMKSIVTPQFNVEMASVYPLRFTSVSNLLNVTVAYNVTAGWNIDFAVTNPSKEHVLSYSSIVAMVCYKGSSKWVTVIPAFEQAENNLDFLHSNFDRKPIRVDNYFAISVLGDISYGSSPSFSVSFTGNVKQKKASDGKKKHKRGVLLVWCQLDVEFLTKAGGLMGVATSKMCSTSVDWQ